MTVILEAGQTKKLKVVLAPILPGIEVIEAYWDKEAYEPSEPATFTVVIKNSTSLAWDYSSLIRGWSFETPKIPFSIGPFGEEEIIFSLTVPEQARDYSVILDTFVAGDRVSSNHVPGFSVVVPHIGPHIEVLKARREISAPIDSIAQISATVINTGDEASTATIRHKTTWGNYDSWESGEWEVSLVPGEQTRVYFDLQITLAEVLARGYNTTTGFSITTIRGPYPGYATTIVWWTKAS